MHRIASTVGALGVLALVASAAQAQITSPYETTRPTAAPVEYLTPSIERVGIDAFGRNDAPTALPVSDPTPPIFPCFWNNGPLDNVTAHLAMKNSSGEAFLAADDFYVKYGDFYFIQRVTVCFAVPVYYDGAMNKPQFELALHFDCSGRPDTMTGPIAIMVPVDAVNMGPSAFAGFNLWNVTFEVPPSAALVLSGPAHYWLCPYGIGEFQNGFYYWLSANNGQINGAQAQIKNGAEPWMDVQQCNCPGICTDLYFQLCGRVCCVQKLNVPYDPAGGAKSIQLKGATIDTARAVDNFQIQPGGPRSLCALEAWFATNCPLDKIFVEVYANRCNMPAGKIATIDIDGLPLYDDTGMTYNGVSIYHLAWTDLGGATLPGGQDYWLSIVARGTGSILDKAYWMYLQRGVCNINITEGKVKDPYVPGLEDFTFVSVATAGPPRDFAFVLYSNPNPPPPLGGQDSGVSDENGGTLVTPVSTQHHSLVAPLAR